MITRKLLDSAVITPVAGLGPIPGACVQPPSRDPSEWDREYLLDVAAAARVDSWPLSGHRQLIEAVCADYVQLEAQHRQDADRIAELEAKVARESESHRVTTILQISGLRNELRLKEQCISLSEQLAVQGHAMARVAAAYHEQRIACMRLEGRLVPRLIKVDAGEVFDVSDTGTVQAIDAGSGAHR